MRFLTGTTDSADERSSKHKPKGRPEQIPDGPHQMAPHRLWPFHMPIPKEGVIGGYPSTPPLPSPEEWRHGPVSPRCDPNRGPG